MEQSVASIILAGGKGTRLFPLTQDHCKPAVPFAGKYRLIDVPMSNSINSGIHTIFVIAQFLTAELQHHITKTYTFGPLLPTRIDFLTPHENARGEKVWFAGTADAVRKNLRHLLQVPVDYFLILSGDQLYNINFQDMLAFAKKMDADLTVASLPVLPEYAKRLGILQINEKNNILHFVEKPTDKRLLETLVMPKNLYNHLGFQDPRSHLLASMGIYIFKKKALIRLLENDPREDFGKHLIPKEIQRKKAFAYIYPGYWEDIGTVSSFYNANMALVKGKAGMDIYNPQAPIFSATSHLPGPIIKNTHIESSIICDGCIIEAKKITNSIIGPAVHIDKGTIIDNSIIMGSPGTEKNISSSIGKNCLLEKVILDEQVEIEDYVLLQNKKKISSLDHRGIFIREGIIVIAKNHKIASHFSL